MSPSAPKDEGAPLAAQVAKLWAGDAQAFESLYRSERDRVRSLLYRMVGPGPELDDLVQQVFLELLRALKGFRGQAKLSTYVHRVTANVAIDHVRKRSRRREDPVETLPPLRDEAPGPEEHAARRQAVELTQRALASLNEKKQLVFTMHELGGIALDEIALAEDTPVNTIRSRLHHARIEFADAVARLTGGDR